MEKEYYRPHLRDLYIGYVCERIDLLGVIYDIEQYKSITINFHHIKLAYEEGVRIFKTKYLDKEDLESEGWKNDERYPKLLYKEFDLDTKHCDDCYHKVRYELTIGDVLENKRVQIKKINFGGFTGGQDSQYIYDGFCPSINEFRKIENLLNIK